MGLFGKSGGKQKEEFVIKKGVLEKWNGDSTTIRIPDEVTTIGLLAFNSKAFSNVTEIIFPASLQKIAIIKDIPCFENIKRIVLRGSLPMGYVNLILQNSYNATIEISDDYDVALVDNFLIEKSSQKLLFAIRHRMKGICSIPEGVREIADNALKDCEELEGIIIPGSVTRIGRHAFENCTRMKKAVIPDSVQIIELSAFKECRTLEAVTIPIGVQSIQTATFFGCKSLKEVTIPNSVQSIEGNAFCRCEALKQVVLPESIKQIGRFAFDSCNNLETLYYNAIEVEDFEAFNNAVFVGAGRTNGMNIVFGDSVKRIPAFFLETQREGKSVFFYGVNTVNSGGGARINEIVFSDSIVEIGKDALRSAHPQRVRVKRGSYCEEFAYTQWDRAKVEVY